MLVRCAWHKPAPVIIGEKPGDGISDTMCETCFEAFVNTEVPMDKRKSRWLISKSINGCRPMSMGTADTKEQADADADAMKRFHLERCPQDRIDMLVREVTL